MADDDLMLTNRYTTTDFNSQSDKSLFDKLLKAKDRDLYDKDSPDFVKKIKNSSDSGININENSVAFEQYIKFAETEKQKKIKKTVLNIDSRNRSKTYTFDSVPLSYTTTNPISFVKDSNEFHIDLGETNYIDDIVTHREIILTNLNKSDFDSIGISKDKFEFSPTKGRPIFNVIKYIYESSGSQVINSYDQGKQKYRFNKLQLNIPNNIEANQLYTQSVGNGINISIIINIKISYPSPSHYFIDLGKTFSNVYSVKLISSEIPNTSYTFNENLIETDFGKFKLKTNQNNKLRWINKTDRVNVSSNNVHMASLFFENMPIQTTLMATDLHNKNFQKLSSYYDISNKTDTDYIENVRRLYSLIRVSQEFSTSPNMENLEKRDYYFNNAYLGEITPSGITGPSSTINLPNTVFTYNETFLSQKARELNAFYHYVGYYNTTPSEEPDPYNTTFKFTDNTSLTITITNDDDYIANQINKMAFPIKITLRCPSKPEYLYIFHVEKSFEYSDDTYTASIIPILSHSPNINDSPFVNLVPADKDILLMTVHNNINSDVILNYQKYYPDIWETMTEYYTTSESVLTKATSASIDLKYSNTLSDTLSISDSYMLEYKTYHSFNFVNTLSLQQVKVETDGHLYIYNLDANGNLVEEISNIAKEYNYIKINNSFYLLDTTKEISYSKADKTFKLPLNISLKHTDHSWSDIADEINKIGTVTIEFQKNIENELQFIYINNDKDYSGEIIRINNHSKNNFNYIEYFIAKKVNSNHNKYEVRYKYKPIGADIDILKSGQKTCRFYTESPRIYLRDFVGNYIVTQLSNYDDPLLGYNIIKDSDDNTSIKYNPAHKILQQYEQSYDLKSCYSDLVDVPHYLIIGITNNSTPDGISNLSFAKEYITSTPESNTYMLPKINQNTNKFPTYFNMTDTDKVANTYKVVSNKILTKYPVYELNIASGKYSADSIVKYMLRALDNLKSRVYDYSKGIFYTDTSFHKFIDLNNEYGINQESKFLISVDKSVHSISFKQYKKIFDAHKNTSVVKGQIAYYNEGFPYIYFNVPQISLLNNSLIYMSSGGSLGNMGASATRGEKNIIIPLNYKVRVRQLLPFPKTDAIKNNQNLFAKEDFVEEKDNEVYNEYVDYINDAVSEKSTKNISIDYIVDKIFGIGESGYLDVDNLSEDKLNNLKEEFTNNSLSKNAANITEGSLNKSFINNNGINQKYPSVKNFNNSNENVFTYNRTGTEYFGQAMINGYRNEQSYKEYLGDISPLTDEESYGDSVKSGFETTFIQNELFMRLSDINKTNRDNIIGRLTKVEDKSDKYGNVEIDYDLFSENCLNFKIGDIIIGLDSNTIGIIMPYDYKYNSLPNTDLMTLGAGAYLMNKSVLDSGSLFEKYLSITKSSTNQRNLAKTFIYKMNRWQIERNKTNRGFYIYSNITPNESRLRGARMPNFQLYIPRFFKFLEGEDTALSKFGLLNSENNNQWNYFKTNYEANYSVDIKRSFFNVARNNEIYTDYLIFETKSIDNFSVNDKIYVENHDIILKGGDFRREKFFNVELLENYAGFISKLETIYNTTVLNHNGLSGIGKVTGDDILDNKNLVDKEYKYADTPGNSTAKGIAEFTATKLNLTIDSADTGYGYTSDFQPNVKVDGNIYAWTGYPSIFTNSLSPTLTNLVDIPNIQIQSIAETATVTGELSPEGGFKDIVSITVSGSGYTEPPNITASISGVTATADVVISGIGTATVKSDSPLISGNTVIFSNPKIGVGLAQGEAAEGYMNDDTTIIIYKSGRGYTQQELSEITVRNNGTGDTISLESITIDAIGSVIVKNAGSGYYNVPASDSDYNPICLPEVTIDGLGTEANIVPVSNSSGTITSYNVIHGGSGYDHTTTISVDPPRALFSSTIDNGALNTVDVLWHGSGYRSENIALSVDPPKRTAVASVSVETNKITITDRGTGYVNRPEHIMPKFHYIDKYSAKKSQNVTVSSGSFTIKITNRGSGYISNPTCSISYINGNGDTVNIGDGTATIRGDSIHKIAPPTLAPSFTLPNDLPKKIKLTFSDGDAEAIATFTKGGIANTTITSSDKLGSSKIVVDSPFKEPVVTASIDATVTSINILPDEGGYGYSSSPKPVIKINDKTVSYTSIDENNSILTGNVDITDLSLSNINTPPRVTISPPENISKIPVPFKNIAVYRYFNQDDNNYNMNYYLNCQSKSDNSPESGKFTYNISANNTRLESLKISGVNNIISSLLTSKDLYVITISNDDGIKNTFVKSYLDDGSSTFKRPPTGHITTDTDHGLTDLGQKIIDHSLLAIESAKEAATELSGLFSDLTDLKDILNSYIDDGVPLGEISSIKLSIEESNIIIEIANESTLSAARVVTDINYLISGNLDDSPLEQASEDAMNSSKRVFEISNKIATDIVDISSTDDAEKLIVLIDEAFDIAREELIVTDNALLSIHSITTESLSIYPIYTVNVQWGHGLSAFLAGNAYELTNIVYYAIPISTKVFTLHTSIPPTNDNMITFTTDLDKDENITITKRDGNTAMASGPGKIVIGQVSRDINIAENHHINIKAHRLPIAVSETKDFGTTSIDGSHKTRYISKYSTLGIFERLLDEQINRIYDNMSYNLIKAAELYRTYSVNVFRNRIIKLKVCPIDDKGFCYENALPDGSLADKTLMGKRQVKGFSKKLFPYHEYDIIKSYDKSKFGRDVNIVGVPYKSYRRPHQLLKNTEQTSKAFLPGMGIYVINNETVTSGTKINNNHYNNTSNTRDIELPYSEYTYDTSFIGYVLDTSINSKQDYDRNYRLNSDHFSKVSEDYSVHSEYFIYMLINPDITTSSEMDELFSILNRDNINIVFDANASQDYNDNPLKQPGYVTSKNEYFVDNTSNIYKSKSDDKPYSISKNTYGNHSFLNEQDVLKLYEDETFTNEISLINIDAFLGLTASAISIKKSRLNKTLPYYSFQKRLACATVVSRPVAYEIKNDTNSRKLFHAGDYDYFYKNYLENKAVMRYEAIMDNRNIDNMNRHNMIIDTPCNKNFKSNNFKDTDCHSSYLDPNISLKKEFYDLGIENNEYKTAKGNKPLIKFKNGDDIILVDSYKNKFSYESGDIDYQEIKPIDDKKLGLPNTHIKILTGCILPPLYFDHNRLYDNRLNDYCNNVTILDKDFDSGLERLTYNGMLGKYKPDKIDIVGNNSLDYNGNDENDHELYNKVFIKEIEDNNTILIDTIIGGINVMSNDANRLKDCLFIINTNIKCKNETQPIDDTNYCEMSIISNVSYTTDHIKLTLKNGLINKYQSNTTNANMRAFIVYPTVSITESITTLNESEISIAIAGTDKIDIGNYIILGWGSIDNMVIRRVENINTITSKITIKHPRPHTSYNQGSRIIVLKNPLTRKSKISNNFISTQPFTMNNEWYTRIFYKGASSNTGKHADSLHTTSEILPNITDSYIHGGSPLFNKNYSNTVYVGGMKGLKIPFINIDNNDPVSVYCRPLEDGFYDIVSEIKDDFQIDSSSAPNILKIPGVFSTRLENLNNLADFENNTDIDNIDGIIWKDTFDLIEYPSIVIKGLYLGYGGFIEERADQDTINTMVNKASSVAIKKITQVKNTFYIYTQFSKTYNNILSISNLSENYNLLNQTTSKTYLDYETNLKLLDTIFENDSTKEEYEEHLALFGKNGKIVRKKINTPYNMNPDNYIYMVIPDLNHISSVQNSDIDKGFAKILLPGESTNTLFSSFVAGTKIFYNNLFNNLSELEITFITNDGYLFDFNGSEHSFSIEITEIIDKFEYINPRFGNIEI